MFFFFANKVINVPGCPNNLFHLWYVQIKLHAWSFASIPMQITLSQNQITNTYSFWVINKTLRFVSKSCRMTLSGPNSWPLKLIPISSELHTKGPFTHETESPWPLHFNHSYWWKRRSQSKFASHYARGTNGICACKMDVKSTCILTWHQMDHVSWLVGLLSKTTSWR